MNTAQDIRNAAFEGQLPPEGDWDFYGVVGDRGVGATWGGLAWIAINALEGTKHQTVVSPHQGLSEHNLKVFSENFPVTKVNKTRREVVFDNGSVVSFIYNRTDMRGLRTDAVLLDNADGFDPDEFMLIWIELRRACRGKMYWNCFRDSEENLTFLRATSSTRTKIVELEHVVESKD